MTDSNNFEVRVAGPGHVTVRRCQMPHTTGSGEGENYAIALEQALNEADSKASAEIHRARMDYDQSRRHRVWPVVGTVQP